MGNRPGSSIVCFLRTWLYFNTYCAHVNGTHLMTPSYPPVGLMKATVHLAPFKGNAY